MLQVERRRVRSHGAVDEDRYLRNPPFVLQPAPEEEDLLRAADGECGDEERSAALHGVEDRGLELLAGRLGRMRAVAVSAFQQHRVRLDGIVGIGEERGPVAAQVAGEQEPPAVGPDVEECAAENVAGLVEGDLDAVDHVDGNVVPEPFQPPRRGLGIGGGVQRQSRLMLAVPAPVRVPRFLLLQVPAVGEQQPGELARRLRAHDPSHHALGAQARKKAGMIDVGVRQDHGVELSRRPRFPISQAQLLAALEQARVDQDAFARRRGEEVARSGDGLGGAKESDRGHRVTLPHPRELRPTPAARLQKQSRRRLRAHATDSPHGSATHPIATDEFPYSRASTC